MKIAHVMNKALVQGTPARIAHYWGRYFAEHSGIAVVLRRSASYEQNIKCITSWHDSIAPNGFVSGYNCPKDLIRDIIKEADVVHFHDDCYPSILESHKWKCNLKNKRLVFQAHIGSIPDNYFHMNRKFAWDKRVRHASIPNGYGRIFDKVTADSNGKRVWYRLSDVLDLSHPVYAPNNSLRFPMEYVPMKVVYTYSNHREGSKINAKRPLGHMRLLKQAKVNYEMCTGRSFEFAMALKKTAHVVLEEIFTPYLHLSALEGLAVGAMVLTNFDAYTKREVCEFLDASEREWPFYYVTPDTIVKELIKLKHEPEIVREYGKKGREWILKYHEPKRILEKFIRFYENTRVC